MRHEEIELTDECLEAVVGGAACCGKGGKKEEEAPAEEACDTCG